MENAKGTVFKYKDNVDTDVIIPARYLNTPNAKELASHCMEDIDTSFVQKVKSGDIIVADENMAVDHPESMHHLPSRRVVSVWSLPKALPASSIAMPSISDFRFWSVKKQPYRFRLVMK